MTTSNSKFNAIVSLFRKMGPYLLLELLMPGGTILALLLFLYRRGALGDPIAALRAGPVTRALSGWLGNVRIVTRRIARASARRGRGRDGLEALAMLRMPHVQ